MEDDLEEKPISTKSKISDILSKYLDSIISVISIWITIILFATCGEYIPDLQWPYYSDQILIFITVLLLVGITLDVLKPLIGLAIIVALVFVIFAVYNYNFQEEKIMQIDEVNISNSLDYTRPFEVIETISIQNETMKIQLDNLNTQLEAINKQLIEIKEENTKKDSLKGVK